MKRQLFEWARPVAAGVLGLVRVGPRRVLWTPPRLGFGNHLYLWMWAFNQRRDGAEAAVLIDDGMRPWFDEFPFLRELTLERADVRFTDRRIIDFMQGWDIHYSTGQIDAFAARLAAQPRFAQRVRRMRDALREDELVINIRRGDYYSVPEFRERFGMNIEGWVAHIVPVIAEQRPISRVRFVSDDLAWCEQRLRACTADYETSFERLGDGPADDLATLAAAPTLVLANSTFSYWGAHLNAALGADRAAMYAPRFHARFDGREMAWQLDERWSIVEHIEGGWAEPTEPTGTARSASEAS